MKTHDNVDWSAEVRGTYHEHDGALRIRQVRDELTVSVFRYDHDGIEELFGAIDIHSEDARDFCARALVQLGGAKQLDHGATYVLDASLVLCKMHERRRSELERQVAQLQHELGIAKGELLGLRKADL